MDLGNKGDSASLQPQEELLQALERQDIVRFRELLNNPQVDPRHKYGKPHFSTCLEIASRRPFGGEYVRALLERVKPNVNVIIPEPIHHAAKRGHSDVLAALLADKRTKANAHDSEGRTALHYACGYASSWNLEGYENCVEQLIFRFAPIDINRPDIKGFTAIHAAIKYKPGKLKTSFAKTANESSREMSGTFKTSVGEQDDDAWRARRRIVELVLQLAQEAIDLDSSRVHGRTAREDLLIRFPDLKSHLPLRTERVRADPHTALVDTIRDNRLDVFRALLQETDADGNPTLDPNHWFGAPLHTTCLELACEKCDGVDFVKALLIAGADPNLPNKLNQKFPIHVTCERGYSDILDALFRYSTVTVDPNCTDRFGNTALHYVVMGYDRDSSEIKNDKSSDFSRCLEFLLGQDDIFVNRLNFRKKSALHVALEHRNRHAVEAILDKKMYRLNLDLTNDSGVLRDLILEEYPDMEIKIPKFSARLGASEVVEEREIRMQLLELLRKKQEDEVVKILLTQPPKELSRGDRQNSLLQLAARRGLAKATRALLTAGADPNTTVACNRSPPIVLASYYGHSDVLKVFLEPAFRIRFDVNATDMKGNSALHFAVKKQDLESVILLLMNGADSKKRNKMGKKAFNKLNVEGLLDKCIDTNGAPAQAEDYEIILDYRLLAVPPYREKANASADEEVENIPLKNLNVKSLEDIVEEVNDDDDDILDTEMGILTNLIGYSGGTDLLQHPVTASFLDLKWARVKSFAIFNLMMYVLFLIFLNVHIVSYGSRKASFNGQEENTENVIDGSDIITMNTSSVNSTLYNSSDINEDEWYYPFPVTSWWLLFLSLFFLAREITQCVVNFEKYRKNEENILDLATVVVTLWIILPPVFDRQYEVAQSMQVLAIMLSCFELLLLTGRISVFARNIEMLKVVVKNTVITLMSYVIILVAFALSFHMVFRDTPSSPDDEQDLERFHSVPYSMLKVVIMMTGELEAGNLPLESSPAGTILFVVFVVGVTIILLNLLIGLAVSDTQKIQDDAEKLWLRTRVHMVQEIEGILVHLHNRWPWRGRVRQFLARGTLFRRSAQRKEARVRPNEKAELELHGGVALEDRKERALKRNVLKEATRLLSGRAARWRQPDRAVLEEVLEVVRRLEERAYDDSVFEFSDRASSPSTSSSF